MDFLILLLCTLLAVCAAQPTTELTDLTNSTDSNKDMYVINAMVYQIGIITNKTDDEDGNSTTMGHQEAVTFFKSNGSGIDLGNISTPLLTNVTAQVMLGVAPVEQAQSPLTNIQQLASLSKDNEMKKESKENRDEESQIHRKSSVSKRALNQTQPINSEDDIPVKIEKGVVVVPDEAGVKSLTIPPLISFNNNFTEIPVPIPNTSVVHYAKLNTLLQTP